MKEIKLIDLSHSIYDKMPTYPSDPDITIVQEKEISLDGSLLHSFKMGTHTGTHLDVPSHIIKGGKTLDKFSLDTFVGRAVKVDEKTDKNLDDLGDSFDGIIFDTGWYNKYKDPAVFFGPNRPVIPSDLIKFSLSKRIKFFGCDLPSVDASGSKNKLVHHEFLRSGTIIYESLTNLDKIPLLTPFKFFGLPLSLTGLDGSPVRAIGIIQT